MRDLTDEDLEVHKKLVRTSRSQREKLVLIRNPWGFKEWAGDWSDLSDMWHIFPDAMKNIKKLMKERGEAHTKRTGEESYVSVDLDENDGCFWMRFDDFFRYFTASCICYYEEKWNYNWTYAQHQTLPPRSNSVYKLNLNYFPIEAPKADLFRVQPEPQIPFSVLTFDNPADEDDACILTFNQVNNRHVDETMRGTYSYAPIRVVVCRLVSGDKIQSDNLQYVCDDSAEANSLNIRLDQMPKGRYAVFYRYEWTNKHVERMAVISLYCPNKIELKHVDAITSDSVVTEDLLSIIQDTHKRKGK